MNRVFALGSIGFLTGIGLVAGNARAHLGGFESADGYLGFLNMTQNYNAGHYGANTPYGGGPSAITPNTDFWVAVAGGGGSGSTISYATGHQNYDRTWNNSGFTSGAASDQALVLTTCHLGWGGPALEYTYSVDSSDLGGVSPASTGGSIVNISFWWRTSLAGSDSGGFVPEGYFGNAIQFRDSSNNVGLQLGITQHTTGDKVTLWNGGSLFETPIFAPQGKYDRWDLSINLLTDTFSADYYQFIPNTLTPLVVNQPLMTAMSDFTSMDFRTSPGVTNDKGHGLNLDDFQMSAVPVPEPTTAGALLVAGVALLMRRRRRA